MRSSLSCSGSERGRTGRALLELTKPGITISIGATAAAGFMAARGGWGEPLLLAVTVVATMLMSAGAAALNQVHERDHDARMVRTAMRPIPAGVVPVAVARLWGWGLSVVGLAGSLLLLPRATSLFLAACHVSYIFVYTPLKRRTPLCTLAGAVPGALPVLAGWTASGQAIDVAALALTGVLFMWQIPHFLAIGWLAREDYATAGCPMLAVVEGSGRASARVSLVYAAALVVCVLLFGIASAAGTLYLLIALPAGSVYVLFAWRFLQARDREPARRLFLSSLVVLPLLLTALFADLAIR